MCQVLYLVCDRRQGNSAVVDIVIYTNAFLQTCLSLFYVRHFVGRSSFRTGGIV